MVIVAGLKEKFAIPSPASDEQTLLLKNGAIFIDKIMKAEMRRMVLEEATRMALEHAKKGDRVLFSPAFEAAGSDASRKERGESICGHAL